eukprot:gnl/MRDRNA2_/MRDRNA2_113731_c0_seq1.p1 gnl/MRDRNA2_/MRDRNA2_113731_c0~~gnl/MRDRNA2_/MRDRNA2_113731_c0_seq1.p1  ORF type:complete len:247 (+),score=49.54 gnl/MRDRNA2_/MRDRNA2_113731_c0_seq1:159-899(+)
MIKVSICGVLFMVVEAVSPPSQESMHPCAGKNVSNVLSRRKSNKELDLMCQKAVATKSALLHDFVAGEGIAVTPKVINDSVMGGKSTSSVSLTSEGALFQGTVTRENNGGFASVRFKAADNAALVQMLKSGSGIRFVVRHIEGCNAWKLQLNGDGNWVSSIFGAGWVQWQADFLASSDGEAQQIAFSELVPTRYGKPLGDAGLAGGDLDSIVGFGFMLSFLTAEGANSSAFSVGPFALNVVRVEVF